AISISHLFKCFHKFHFLKLTVILCLVSHHILCGQSKHSQTFPQLPPIDSHFYPASPHSKLHLLMAFLYCKMGFLLGMHVKEEPLQCIHEEMQLKMDEPSTSRTDIGDLLKSRLEAAENDDNNNEDNCKNNESPLEYAYEGSDEEPFQHVEICSENNLNKNESQLSSVNNPSGFE
ncbi:unnamed protein product, partial [Schistosoma mattheei]